MWRTLILVGGALVVVVVLALHQLSSGGGHLDLDEHLGAGSSAAAAGVEEDKGRSLWTVGEETAPAAHAVDRGSLCSGAGCSEHAVVLAACLLALALGALRSVLLGSRSSWPLGGLKAVWVAGGGTVRMVRGRTFEELCVWRT